MIGAAAQIALGVVPSLISTGMNIGQLIGAKNAQKDARKKFESEVTKIENLMQKNVAEEFNVSDEATKLKYLQNLARTKQMSQDLAGAGQRAVAAGMPALMTRQEAADEEERLKLQQRLEARDKMIIGQDEALRKEQKEFGEEMAALRFGQEQQERNRSQELFGQVLKGVGDIAVAGIEAAPLFKKGAGERQAGKLVDSLGGEFEGLTHNQALDAILGSGLSKKQMKDARKYGQGGIDEILQSYYQGLQPNTSTGVGLSAPLTGFSGMSLTPQSQQSPFDIGINQRFFNPTLTLNNTGLGNPMQYNQSYLSLLNPNG